jgi:plastocyanin
MRKVLILVLVVLLVGVAGYLLFFRRYSGVNTSGGSGTRAGANVSIENFAFVPQEVVVKVGETVTWKNNDSSAHTVTFNDGSFDSGVISSGKSKSHVFTKVGTYPYHCSLHPGMAGSVVVTP